MNNRFLKHFLTAALVSGASVASSGVHAITYIHVAGADADFYYNADFFGPNAATVHGNEITLSVFPDYSLSDQVHAPSVTGATGFSEFVKNAVIAVAHNGYSLVGAMTPTLHGTYAVSGGAASASMTIDYAPGWQGSLAAGQFSTGKSIGWYNGSTGVSSKGASVSGSWTLPAAAHGFNGDDRYSAVSTSLTLRASTYIVGVGSAEFSLGSVSFNANVFAGPPIDVPVPTPVPEPESYAMLLAGFGLLGFMAKRRKATVA